MVRVGDSTVAKALGPRLAEGLVALCAPVIFELGFSARTAADHMALIDRVDAFERAPTNEGDFVRAIELQSALADRGQHRAISLVHALVAAVAEARGLTLLHYDKDFDLIADLTDQPTEWIVPPGSVD